MKRSVQLLISDALWALSGVLGVLAGGVKGLLQLEGADRAEAIIMLAIGVLLTAAGGVGALLRESPRERRRRLAEGGTVAGGQVPPRGGGA